MQFQEIMQRAIERAGSRNKLARLLSVNHNAPRNWVIGLALPTPEKEAPLAAAAGLTADEVEQAIQAERKRRWERLRRGENRGLPHATKPPAKARGRHPARELAYLLVS